MAYRILDEYERPTEVFKRMADAMYYLMDNRCEPRYLRDSGMIEPEKYAWMLTKRGITPDAARLRFS